MLLYRPAPSISPGQNQGVKYTCRIWNFHFPDPGISDRNRIGRAAARFSDWRTTHMMLSCSLIIKINGSQDTAVFLTLVLPLHSGQCGFVSRKEIILYGELNKPEQNFWRKRYFEKETLRLVFASHSLN